MKARDSLEECTRYTLKQSEMASVHVHGHGGVCPFVAK